MHDGTELNSWQTRIRVDSKGELCQLSRVGMKVFSTLMPDED